MTRGINKRRIALIKKHFGIVICESTWRGWRKWWRDEFVITKFWWAAFLGVPSHGAYMSKFRSAATRS